MNEIIENRLNIVRNDLMNPPDLVVREIENENFCGAVAYLSGLINTEELENSVLRPLVENKKIIFYGFKELASKISYGGVLKEIAENEMKSAVVSGSAVIITENTIIEAALKKTEARSIAEPPTNSVIKGPREGFNEEIRTNLSMLRKRVKSEFLTVEEMIVGEITKTKVQIVYLRNVVNDKIIVRIKQKISAYKIDGIIDSSYLARFLEDKPYSLFRQVGNSEKPDIIAERLLDGKVAVLVDGSPIALVLPFLLFEDFEDSQDNYKRPLRATFLRYVRFFGALCALLLPALFVAVQLHQFQLLPLELLITILKETDKTPFSPTLEMLIALLLFEILGEASIRMPRHVGMALSVVGAIVLGETAVSAGLLSSITILVVAISGIGLYAVPDEVGTIGILRVLFVIIANFFGIFGILVLSLMLLGYITALGSYGVPYLMPLAPVNAKELGNVIFKKSLLDIFMRPAEYMLKNKRKIKKVK